MLEVAGVDQRLGQFTPVAQWNFREVRRRRASRDIKPGDRIPSVNGSEDLLSELHSAASLSSPKDAPLRFALALHCANDIKVTCTFKYIPYFLVHVRVDVRVSCEDVDLRLEREMSDVFGPRSSSVEPCGRSSLNRAARAMLHC